MPYVYKNDEGDIMGSFARPQPGLAMDFLPDDDSGVKEYKAKREKKAKSKDLSLSELNNLVSNLLKALEDADIKGLKLTKIKKDV